jgi:hypothetical protein
MPLLTRPEQRSMMYTAERDRTLVADLDAEGLRETNMMGIAGGAPAHEARLQADEIAMLFVAITPWLTESEHALVNRGDGPRRSRAMGVISCG